MARIKKTVLPDSIFLLEFPTQYELAATFLRFQEHYESRKYHGRTFTLEEYMDWYAKEHGNFTYYEDWVGFNIPSTALTPFYAGEFNPLSKKETRLLELLRDEKDDYYVIGLVQTTRAVDKKLLQHEIAHALFHVKPTYRNEVLRHLRGQDLSRIQRELFAMGYSRHVIRDEIQAYLISGTGNFSAIRRQLVPLGRKLRSVYRRHAQAVEQRLG